MVLRITTVIEEYQDRLYEMDNVPKTSFGKDSLSYSGEMNKRFLRFLFSNHTISLQFPKDARLSCIVIRVVLILSGLERCFSSSGEMYEDVTRVR
jgi:hypothetical protein